MRSPFLSPDGASLGFNLSTGGGPDRFSTVALGGGTPISLGEQPPVSVWGTWSEDGYIYFVSDANAEIFIPEAIPGVPGRLLVTARFPDEAVTGTGILDVETGEATLIPGLAQAFEGVYAGGYLFWINAEEILVAARLDPIRGELTSPLVTLAEGVAEQGGSTVSQTGTPIYRGSVMGSSSGGGTVGWITRSGETEVIDERLAGDVGDFDDARLSPDGRYLAVEVERGGDGSSEEAHRILIYVLDQGTSYRLSFDGRYDIHPRWRPDGRVATAFDEYGAANAPGGEWVAYVSNESGRAAQVGGTSSPVVILNVLEELRRRLGESTN